MRDLMLCPRRLDVSDACRLVTPVTDVDVAVCMLPSAAAASESSKFEEIYDLISFPEEMICTNHAAPSTVLLKRTWFLTLPLISVMPEPCRKSSGFNVGLLPCLIERS
jgi:hypothetical protein